MLCMIYLLLLLFTFVPWQEPNFQTQNSFDQIVGATIMWSYLKLHIEYKQPEAPLNLVINILGYDLPCRGCWCKQNSTLIWYCTHESTDICDLSQPQNHSNDSIDEYFINPITREFSAKSQGLNGLLNTIVYTYHYLVYHLTIIQESWRDMSLIWQ